MIEPVRLARLPTPVEPLPAASERLGTELWIKRDDLTGTVLSGNKVRKLEFLLAEALAQGADTVVTCGGIQSNHCRATALAARRLGMRPVLLLRGTPPPPEGLEGNLLLDALAGAEVRWTDEDGYARRDALMAHLAHDLAALDQRPHVIPEGGSNAVGALGFVQAARELTERFDTVVCACGSAGTVAGLALAGLRVRGIAVGSDRATFRARVEAIGQEAAARFGLRLSPDWDVVDGFQGRGYALARPEELRCQARFTRETGLVLDPIYTGKAWFALEALLRRDRAALGRRVLFWHTGGVFGIFGRGAEYADALGDTIPGLADRGSCFR